MPTLDPCICGATPAAVFTDEAGDIGDIREPNDIHVHVECRVCGRRTETFHGRDHGTDARRLAEQAWNDHRSNPLNPAQSN